MKNAGEKARWARLTKRRDSLPALSAKALTGEAHAAAMADVLRTNGAAGSSSHSPIANVALVVWRLRLWERARLIAARTAKDARDLMESK